MTQTEEHLTGDGIQVQDDISITIRPAAAWMRNLAAVFLAACGFIGTIAASLSMFSPIYNRTKLILIAAAIFILYSVLSILPKKLRWLTPVSLLPDGYHVGGIHLYHVLFNLLHRLFSSCNLLVHDSPTVFSNWVHCDVFPD